MLLQLPDMRFFVLLILLWINATPFLAQVKNKGIPFIKSYAPKEYQGSTQIWGITQDSRGVMYFGDNIGIAEFDGVHFRRVQADKLFEVGPVFSADDGTLYTGGYGEIGYLQLNPQGLHEFVSLNHLIPAAHRKFHDVWDCHQNADGTIVFKTGSSIIYHNTAWDSLKAHTIDKSFELWEFKGKSYCYINFKDLYEAHPDTLIPIRMANPYEKSEINLICMRPYDDNQSLAVSSNHGLYLFNGERLTKWEIGYDDFFIDGTIRKAIQLSDGTYLFASQKNGILILDQKGKAIQYLNQETGISDNSIFSVFESSDKTVWLGTASGIDRIALHSPFSEINENLKLGGKNVNYIGKEIFNEQLYIGDDKHIYYLPWKPYVDPFTSARFFKHIAPEGGQSWAATVAQNQLLISLNTMIISVDQEKMTKAGDYSTWNLRKFRNHVFGEGEIGIMRYDYNNGKWQSGGMIKGFDQNCRNMVIAPDETFWVQGYNLGIFKIQLNEQLDSAISIQYYDEKKGFPTANDNTGHLVRSEVVFTTAAGIYRYDKATDSMVEHEVYKQLLGSKNIISNVVEDIDGDVWVVSDKGIQLIDFEEGKSPHVETDFFNRFSQYYTVDVYPVGHDILFTTEEGIIHYQKHSAFQLPSSYETSIRKVEVITEKDSSIFLGAYQGSDGKTLAQQPKQTNFIIPYKQNALRFSFAGNFYMGSENTQYSYWLKGNSEGWSAWGKETQKEYTNLGYGDYTFHVKSKNIFNQTGVESTFRFTIARPWYHSYWAYIIYITCVVWIISVIARFYGQKLRRDNEKLEQIIKRRTEEVTTQNEEIIQQRDQLKQAIHSVEHLNEIGKAITSSLSIESLTNTIYDEVNQLMDATMLGVGIYREKENDLYFQTFLEEGETLNPASHELTDSNLLSVQCFLNQQVIVIQDYEKEARQFIKEIPDPKVGKRPTSIIYIPISQLDKKIGVLTVQSFKKEAYTNYHVSLLQNMAVYMAIALENLEAMQQLENLSIVARETISHVVIMDIKGNILWVNSAFLKLFGYPSLDEFISNKGNNLLEFSNSPKIKEVYQYMLENKRPVSYEVLNVSRTGQERWVKTVLNPILNSDGSIKKIFALGTDITDLKNSQEKLLNLTQRLNTINTIDKAILRSASIEDTIYSTVQELKKLFNAQRISIALFDFEEETFTPFATTGLGEQVLNKGNKYPLDAFGGIEVLKKEQHYLVNDINKMESPSNSDLMLVKEGLVSYLLHPMIANGQLLGSLNVCFDRADLFTKYVIEVIQEVANAVGLSISHHRLQEELKENHVLLEKRNKNVTNSIRYAEKIQKAILASNEDLSKYLGDYFLFYKPRDLVSGDFYWLETHNNKVYVAVADCTGHGVPGAMVSVICSNALSKALVEEGNSNTGKLLDRTREIVIRRLSKSGGKEVKDGMDISLCAIDFDQMTLQWSGANNPLWIINADRKEVPTHARSFGVGEGGFEFKGDRQPIGNYPKMKPFSSYDVKLQKGDLIYIFTDGYQDQFGGETGEKYLKKRFKRKLLSLKDETMDDQQAILNAEFDQWRNGFGQIDDICILGIRV